MRKRYLLATGTLLAVMVALGLVFWQRQPQIDQTGGAPLTAAAQASAAPATAAQASAAAAPPSVALDADAGQEIGAVYEAFLSPQQEPGEEEDTPGLTPNEFRSTAPSVPRDQRTSRAHGVLRFTRDLSRAYVDVRVAGLNVEDVIMFHIHCGKPDQLGPILVDFAFSGDTRQNLADGVFSVELTNANIEQTAAAGEGLVGAFTAGCPIVPGLPDKVRTIAGMEHIARQSELYFNLHTRGQTFYGDMRGQVHPAAP